MRRRVVYLAAVVFSLVPIIVTSCGGDNTMNLIFNQGTSSCATVNLSSAVIQCNGGVFSFNGSVITSDPCNYLKAEVELSDEPRIVIEIKAVSSLGQEDYCVECLGEIPFDGTLEVSDACSNTLSIVYNETIIAEYECR